jgi:hypothetical protein
MLGFVHTASMAGKGEKWSRTCGALSRGGGGVESTFSQEKWPCSTLLMTTQKVVIHGLSAECV